MKQLFFIALFFTSQLINGQFTDTIYIKFNKHYQETKKESYNFPNEQTPQSFGYFIRQMEKNAWSDSHFHFSHAQRDSLTYKTFGGKPPLILKKPKSYLKDKQVLDIDFFRTTPYLQICKTFEAEDIHEQDVVIFMIDEDEIENDILTLREVKFSRPIKQ